MRWQIDSAMRYHPREKELLEDGWEPFAVTNEWVMFSDGKHKEAFIWFRKLVKVDSGASFI